MKFLIATAFSLPFAVISNTATAKNLTCTGVLARNNGELQLMPDPGSALWCDASFEGEKCPVVILRTTLSRRCLRWTLLR